MLFGFPDYFYIFRVLMDKKENLVKRKKKNWYVKLILNSVINK